MKLFKLLSCVFPSFSHFGRPKPVFPRTVFTGKYHGKNRVLSKTLQPWFSLTWLNLNEIIAAQFCTGLLTIYM